MRLFSFDLGVRNVAFFMIFTVLSLVLSTFNVAKIVGVKNQWLIPLAASFLPANLLARALGATFTAHAIGSVAFLYGLTMMSASAWLALIPVVALERLVFATGICVSYVAVTSILSMFTTKIDLSFLKIEKQYSLVKV